MKTIYQYTDHKIFLRDWFVEKKKSPSGFSYEKFSQLVGLSSPNYMKMVIEGKRNLTISNIHQVATGLRLSFDETQYLEALTLLNQSKVPQERSYFKHRLRALKDSKPTQSFHLNHFNLIAQWYFPAVVVVLDGCSVDQAPSIIKQKTGLTDRQIQDVISILKEKSMLCEIDGFYKLEFSHFVVQDKKALSDANKKYLLDQLMLSRDLLENKYSKGPKFYAHTFTISRDSFNTFSEKVNSFIETLTTESNAESPDEVIQLNIQLFKVLDREKK